MLRCHAVGIALSSLARHASRSRPTARHGQIEVIPVVHAVEGWGSRLPRSGTRLLHVYADRRRSRRLDGEVDLAHVPVCRDSRRIAVLERRWASGYVEVFRRRIPGDGREATSDQCCSIVPYRRIRRYTRLPQGPSSRSGDRGQPSRPGGGVLRTMRRWLRCQPLRYHARRWSVLEAFDRTSSDWLASTSNHRLYERCSQASDQLSARPSVKSWARSSTVEQVTLNH